MISNGMLNQICKWESSIVFGSTLKEQDLRGVDIGDNPGHHRTFGYGLLYYIDGKRFMDQVKPVFTQKELEDLYIANVNKKAETVEKWGNGLNLKQCQIDALVSLCYNFGPGVLNGSRCSGVCKLIKENPNNPKIKDVWTHGSDSQGSKYPGLKKRRALEAEWYFGNTSGDMSLASSGVMGFGGIGSGGDGMQVVSSALYTNGGPSFTGSEWGKPKDGGVYSFIEKNKPPTNGIIIGTHLKQK